MDQNTPVTLSISPEEQQRRIDEVNYARGSMRLEGFILSPSVEDLNRRYIDGELTSEEFSQTILDLYRA